LPQRDSGVVRGGAVRRSRATPDEPSRATRGAVAAATRRSLSAPAKSPPPRCEERLAVCGICLRSMDRPSLLRRIGLSASPPPLSRASRLRSVASSLGFLAFIRRRANRASQCVRETRYLHRQNRCQRKAQARARFTRAMRDRASR
jgi:hypothetical protein